MEFLYHLADDDTIYLFISVFESTFHLDLCWFVHVDCLKLCFVDQDGVGDILKMFHEIVGLFLESNF